jgi:predicted nuclease with TOPRIM domain
VADENERTLRRLAEAEAQTLRIEVDRLAYECSRLSRKLDHLNALLYELRALPELDEQVQLRIEDALAFDGHTEPVSTEGWADFDLVPEEAEEPR